jgi:hypothetical protein
MKFWSMSRLIESPVMPAALANDLVIWMRTGEAPEHMFPALQYVVNCTAPQFAEGLAIMPGVRCPDRRLLMAYPDATAFEALERFCVFELDDGSTYCHVDAVH